MTSLTQKTATSQPDATIAAKQWFIVDRWQQFEGEGRANLLRVLAIVVFYAVHLANQIWLAPKAPATDAAGGVFHEQVTRLVIAWTCLSLAIAICLGRRIFPAVLKYVASAGDILLLTLLASLSHGAPASATTLAEGPHSPLVLVYFLIIAMAALRFNLGLVWFTTLGSMLGYLALVGMADKVWFDADHTVPPVTQLITLVSLGATGVVLGQVIRRVKGMAEDYAKRVG